MPAERARVIMLTLDSFRPELISPTLTPRLHAVIERGGWAPNGGRCPLPAVTYPSHATLLTGRLPTAHEVRSGVAGTPRAGVVPGWAGEARVTGVPTLFDLCHAGLCSAAVCGDHHLWTVLNAAVADYNWPPDGALPAGIDRDAFGYATNAASHRHALSAVRDGSLDVVFAHYNEPDTMGHLFGPDAPETLRCYEETDALVGDIVEALQSDWQRMVLIVLSDHGMEPVPRSWIDLLSDEGVSAIASEMIPEAGCALVRLRAGTDSGVARAILAGLPRVADVHRESDRLLLVETIPGVGFGSAATLKSVKGCHGGSTTTKTLAIVAGGHPAVARIAATIASTPPHLADWMPTIAAVLGCEPVPSDGRSLLDRTSAGANRSG